MTDAHGTTLESHDEPHGGDHGDAPHHDAGHDTHLEGQALGPIDWAMWGAGVLGVALGLLVAVVIAISAGRFGTPVA